MKGDMLTVKERILVDVCCGPCAIPIEEIYSLMPDFEVVLYVTNSNVHPFSEYVKRLGSIRQAAKYYKTNVVVDNYNPREWLEIMKGMEFEPEGGKRCIACYNYRLEKTAQYATTHGFNYFSTTITTGPSKDAKKINQIGSELAVKYKITFLELDLKKQGGFLKSIVMSKKLGLYRQNYCGCIFSMNAPRSEKRTRKLEKQAMME
jgi:predicted adenine nucleotide alpha hydrolase (AANH) superfamily ATPase